jgi:MFS family permease
MEAVQSVVTASALLLGFLFAGFWWAIDRELKFPPEERHFKLGYALLFLAVIALGVFGIVLPLRAAALRLPLEPFIYIGLGAALVGVIGYMLTEFGHYRVFQVPKYVTGSELFFFVVTLLIMFAAFIASADAMLGGAIRTLVKG